LRRKTRIEIRAVRLHQRVQHCALGNMASEGRRGRLRGRCGAGGARRCAPLPRSAESDIACLLLLSETPSPEASPVVQQIAAAQRIELPGTPADKAVPRARIGGQQRPGRAARDAGPARRLGNET